MLQQLHNDDPDAFDQLVNAGFAATTRGKSISRAKENLYNPVKVGNLFFEANLPADRMCRRMIQVLHAMGRSIDDGYNLSARGPGRVGREFVVPNNGSEPIWSPFLSERGIYGQTI